MEYCHNLKIAALCLERTAQISYLKITHGNKEPFGLSFYIHHICCFIFLHRVATQWFFDWLHVIPSPPPPPCAILSPLLSLKVSFFKPHPAQICAHRCTCTNANTDSFMHEYTEVHHNCSPSNQLNHCVYNEI